MSDDNIQLIILSSRDNTVVFQCEISMRDCVENLRAAVSRKTGIPPRHVLLFTNGHRLDDKYNIRDLNMRETATVFWIDERSSSVIMPSFKS